MMRLILFDPDETLAESKQARDEQTKHVVDVIISCLPAAEWWAAPGVAEPARRT